MYTKTLLPLSLLFGALASAYKENPHSLYICLWVRFWMQVRHTIFLTNLLLFLVHIWLSIWIFDIKNKNPFPTFVCFLFFFTNIYTSSLFGFFFFFGWVLKDGWERCHKEQPAPPSVWRLHRCACSEWLQMLRWWWPSQTIW